jgi:5'-phosphate synthase pdxT subunit
VSTAPVVGVLALQGDVREHVAMLERAGATPVTVRRPAELDRVDGLVMPGGESTTMSKLARTFELLDPVREALRGGLPGFGTCAGMIMLADRIEGGVVGQETFGGLDVVVRRNAFGRQVDSFEADLDVVGFRDPFHALFIRAPWVEKVGSDVRVVAKVASGREVGRIVAVRQANLLATSFHPEITGDHRFHRLFVDQVREATG